MTGEPTLSGRKAIVTGGAGHLGSGIALALRDQGCRVVIVDRDPAALARFQKETEIETRACDLSDPVACERTFDGIWQTSGPISILVNAAGRIHSAPLVNIAGGAERRHSPAAWNEVIDANLTSVFLATANVAERMASTRTRGVVINLSSIAAEGNAGQGAYAAAKAGVNAATLAWAKELGPLGIRFVAIALGFIDTPSTHVALSDDAIKDWARRTPLRRLGKIEHVTSTVLYVIRNDFVTGKVIEVDGGLTL